MATSSTSGEVTSRLAAPLRLLTAAPQKANVRRVATLKGHKDRVWCVRWCPTADVLASCSGDATVRFWSRRYHSTKAEGDEKEIEEKEEWICVGTLEGEHNRSIRHIGWSPNGEYIACASFDHTATVWQRDMDSNDFVFEIEGVLDGHESEVKCVEWATDSMLITCSRDRMAWIWERVDEGEYECGGVLTGHVQDVKHCQFILPQNDTDVPLAVTCGYDNTIKIWCEGHHHDDWQCTQTLTAHEATVWATALQKLEIPMEEVRAAQRAQELLPQPLLCSCSDDLTVIFWKRNAERRFVEVSRASGFAERSLFDLDWAPHNASVVACASGDNSFTLLGVYQDNDGVHSCTVARVEDAHLSDVNTVSFASQGSLFSSAEDTSGDGVLLATGSDDRVIHLWRVNSNPGSDAAM